MFTFPKFKIRKRKMKNKVLKFLVAWLFGAGLLANAQLLSVTATLTDTDGQTWNNGTCSISVYNSQGVTPQYNGTPIPTNPVCSINSSGVLSASLYNTNTLFPVSSQYRFTIQSNTSATASVVTTPVTVSNMSSALSALITAPRFNAGYNTRGYADVEAQTSNVGITYYNVSTPAWRQCTVVTSGTCSTWVTVGSGGGSTAPGTPLGSPQFNNAGAFAGQGHVFYQQTGDTISSIEAECSTLCVYVVSAPQTLTLSGNHTLSSNVCLRFEAQGIWTVNGGTLTIPCQIFASSDTIHFTGSGSVSLSNSQISALWFAAGDGSTDDTAALNAAITATQNGTLYLGCHTYHTSATLTISQSNFVLFGCGTASTLIKDTSASGAIISMGGSNLGAPSTNVSIQNLTAYRTVPQTTGTDGIMLQFIISYQIPILNHVYSEDSVYPIHIHGVSGGLENFIAFFCSNGVTEPSGTYAGVFVDSMDGTPNNSLYLSSYGTSNSCGSGITTRGLLLQGTRINDFFDYNVGMTRVTTGVYVNYTGGASIGAAADIHFKGDIIDQIYQNAYEFHNLSNATNNSATSPTVQLATVSESWISPGGDCISTCDGVLIDNSQGVAVTGLQISLWTNAIHLSGGSILNQVAQNTIIGGGNGNELGIFIDGAGGNSINDNNLKMKNAAACISLANTSQYNSVVHNLCNSVTATQYGITSDAPSTANIIDNNNVGGSFSASSYNLLADPAQISGPLASASHCNSGGFFTNIQGCIYVESPNFSSSFYVPVFNGSTSPILAGTTGSIGGSALLAGQCSAGTATVTGATTSMTATASPSSDPDSNLSTGVGIYSFVSASNTVTVRVCAIVAVTPAATTYNVRVIQ